MPADITHLGLATVFQTLMFIMAEHRVCFFFLFFCPLSVLISPHVSFLSGTADRRGRGSET